MIFLLPCEVIEREGDVKLFIKLLGCKILYIVLSNQCGYVCAYGHLSYFKLVIKRIAGESALGLYEYHRNSEHFYKLTELRYDRCGSVKRISRLRIHKNVNAARECVLHIVYERKIRDKFSRWYATETAQQPPFSYKGIIRANDAYRAWKHNSLSDRQIYKA